MTRWLLTGHGQRRQRAEDVDAGRVEPGLLDGLAQRRLAGSAVRRLEPPAGERDLPGVAAEAGRAPLQQHVEVVRRCAERAGALELAEQDEDRGRACVGRVGQDASRVDAPVDAPRAQVDELVARASDVRGRRGHPRARTRSPNTANAFSAAGTRIGQLLGAGGADRLDLVVGEVRRPCRASTARGRASRRRARGGTAGRARCRPGTPAPVSARSRPAAWRPAAGRPSPSASAGRSGGRAERAEHRVVRDDVDRREPDLGAGPPPQPGAEREREQLHAEADAEHGDVGVDRRREQRLLGGQARVARSGRRRPCCRP